MTTEEIFIKCNICGDKTKAKISGKDEEALKSIEKSVKEYYICGVCIDSPWKRDEVKKYLNSITPGEGKA